jgi:hypothetical protein
MDRNNRIVRRERFEILKIAQGLGEGVVAVDKSSLRPLRPNTILGALEESIARRTREGRIWSAFLDQFWIGRRVDGTDATGPTIRGHHGELAKLAELLPKVETASLM